MWVKSRDRRQVEVQIEWELNLTLVVGYEELTYVNLQAMYVGNFAAINFIASVPDGISVRAMWMPWQ